jgi:hypothetical protein
LVRPDAATTAAESFFATLKNEMYHRQRFNTSGESPIRGGGIHRNLLQPRTAALTPGLPHPKPKPSPTTRPEQPPDHHNHQELSKILDTARVS